MANGLDIYETSVTIPLNQEDPWIGTIVGSELDTTVEQTAHVVLTSLCESRLAYRDADRAFPDLESGKSCVEAAP
jgi:hypothetical protein